MRRRLKLRIEGTRTVAALWRGRRLLGRGAAPVLSDEDLEAGVCRAIHAALSRRDGWKPPATIEIGYPWAQVRRVRDLPPVSRRDLARMVAGAPDRYFRVNGEPLVVDTCWTRSADGRRTALIAGTPESIVRRLSDTIAGTGLRLDGIAPASVGSVPLSLLSPTEIATRARRILRRGILATAAGTALWVAVAAAAAIGMVRERRALESEAARIRPGLEALHRVEREMAKASGAVGAVQAASMARGAVLLTLAEIASALPDSAFLDAMTIAPDGSVRVSGSARQSARLLAVLEDLPGFAGVRLEGTPIRTTVGGRSIERFSIVMTRVAP